MASCARRTTLFFSPNSSHSHANHFRRADTCRDRRPQVRIRQHLRARAGRALRPLACRAGAAAHAAQAEPCARGRTRLRCRCARRPPGCRDLLRQRNAGRRDPDRPGLRRPPVRRLLPAARRRPRAAARRSHRPAGQAPRHRVQGLGPHAVLARRRRQGRARPRAARIPDRRSDARARRADHARARGRGDRRVGAARVRRPARRGADARGRQPHPRRHVPVRRARGATPTACAGSPTT